MIMTTKNFIKTCLAIYGGYWLLKALSKKVCVVIKIERSDKEKG